MRLGPETSSDSKTLMVLGAGELGKEIIIEAQRLGLHTVAVDRYAGAPAMAVAHQSHVIDMTDPVQLTTLINQEQPHWVVPEIEALATQALSALESPDRIIVPTARAAQLTMNREGIRRLAAESLHLTTAAYAFADTLDQLQAAAATLGFPCVVKPLMSSSGKGQSVCRNPEEVAQAWHHATTAGRVRSVRVIVEEWIEFDSEITVLTVRSRSQTLFCPPIGHRQEHGDYIESWQPHPMTEQAWDAARRISRTITEALGGYGIFGVELFLAGDRVYFSEVSPRPHDTGMVTLVTQDLSEFALHVRALTGLPIPQIQLLRPGASRALKSPNIHGPYVWAGLHRALAIDETSVRLFGKPSATPGRRLGVVLSTAPDVDQARQRANLAASALTISAAPE